MAVNDTVIPLDTLDTNQYLYRFIPNEMIRTGLIGLFVGFLAALLAGPMSRLIIEPIFCRGASTLGVCDQANTAGFNATLIVVSIAALLLMVSWQIYQPVLNALAPAVAFWGLDRLLGELAADHKIQFYVFSALTLAVAYLLFYALLRIKMVIMSFVLVALTVVLLRLQF